jgi:hypothetical protein
MKLTYLYHHICQCSEEDGHLQGVGWNLKMLGLAVECHRDGVNLNTLNIRLIVETWYNDTKSPNARQKLYGRALRSCIATNMRKKTAKGGVTTGPNRGHLNVQYSG